MKLPIILRGILANSLYIVVNFIQRSPHKKVVVAFRSRYPEATFPTWEFQGEGVWEVTFTLKRKEHCAIFNSYGNWLGTRTLISGNMLPVKIWEHLKAHFIKPDFLKIFQLNMPQGMFYELDIYDGSNFIHLSYDGNGVLHNEVI